MDAVAASSSRTMRNPASPSVVGWLNDFTGKQSAGLMFTSSALLVGAALVLLLPAKTVNR